MATAARFDLKTLKESTDFGMVLAHYGIHFKQRQNELRCDCPFHEKGVAAGSFAYGIADRKWYCHFPECRQATGFSKGGDVYDFICLMERISGKGSVMTAARKLMSWSVVAEPATTSKIETEPKSATPDKNKVLGFELKGIQYHPYLEQRGVSKELAEKFGIGFFPGKGSMQGRIVIPIRDEAGQLVAYAGRALNGDEPKYKLPLGFQKHLVLFNLHAVKAETVTLVEGFFGCLRVTEAGFPCVGLIGSTLSEEQEKLLRSFKFITLMLDPDEAGAAGTADLVARLSRGHYVRVAQNSKCPDDMTLDEIRNVLRYVCPT